MSKNSSDDQGFEDVTSGALKAGRNQIPSKKVQAIQGSATEQAVLNVAQQIKNKQTNKKPGPPSLLYLWERPRERTLVEPQYPQALPLKSTHTRILTSYP